MSTYSVAHICQLQHKILITHYIFGTRLLNAVWCFWQCYNLADGLGI